MLHSVAQRGDTIQPARSARRLVQLVGWPNARACNVDPNCCVHAFAARLPLLRNSIAVGEIFRPGIEVANLR